MGKNECNATFGRFCKFAATSSCRFGRNRIEQSRLETKQVSVVKLTNIENGWLRASKQNLRLHLEFCHYLDANWKIAVYLNGKIVENRQNKAKSRKKSILNPTKQMAS